MPTYAAAVERNKELLCTNCNHSFKVTFKTRAGVDSGFFHDVTSGFKDDPASRLSRHIVTDKILVKLIGRRHQETAHGIYDVEDR